MDFGIYLEIRLIRTIRNFQDMNKQLLRNILIIFGVYSLLLIFIGRQLSFIPQINFKDNKKVLGANTSNLRKNVLEKFLKGEKGSWSVYYKDLVTGEEFGIDENRVTTAASLNKMPIIAYLYNLAGKNKIDLETRIAIQKDDIQDYGTGSIRYQKPGGFYSLKTLAKLMLEQSDNTAAHVLGVRLGIDKIQAYAKSIGLVATDMENNNTTAKEQGTIWGDIYARKVTTEALTREILDFSRDTDFEDRLARDLPKGVAVSHKAADGVGFVHDGGIVIDQDKKFILVVMASDIKSTEGAKDTMAKIAKFVYDNK